MESSKTWLSLDMKIYIIMDNQLVIIQSTMYGIILILIILVIINLYGQVNYS